MISTLPTFDILVLREVASGSKINLQDIVKKGKFGFFGALFLHLFFFLQGIIFQFRCFIVQLVLLILPFYEITTTFRNFLVGKGLQNRALTIQIRNKIFSIILMLFGVLIYIQLSPSRVAGFAIFLPVQRCLTLLLTLV